ncbi:MAG: ankyrin repeat protein [Nevskia sp.]|nr:ankyrin repeat protein [Nevskia sp.]
MSMDAKHPKLGWLAALSLMLVVVAVGGCAQTAGKPEAAAVQDNSDGLSPEDRLAFFVNHARNGECDEVAKGIKAGIPVNQLDALDQTALIAAVSHNSIACVRLLLDHGADPKVTDNAGWTPLIFAAYFGGSDELLNLLLDRGADINAQNDRGITALYLASASGHVPQVKLLLARGADRQLASKSGYTPLRIAQLKTLDPIVALLDPNAPKSAPASQASNGAPAIH